jgi:hypothetical protein
MAQGLRVGACRARRPPAQKHHSAVDRRHASAGDRGVGDLPAPTSLSLAGQQPRSALGHAKYRSRPPAHRAERSARRGDCGDTYACVRPASSAGGAVGRGAAGASSAAWGDVHTAGTESMWVWMSGFGRSVAGAGPIAGDVCTCTGTERNGYDWIDYSASGRYLNLARRTATSAPG